MAEAEAECLVQAVCGHIAHLGPEWLGVAHAAALGLGMVPLAIVDVDRAPPPRVAATGNCMTIALDHAGIARQGLAAEAGESQRLVRSSLAGYFAAWVADAAAEYADPAQLAASL